MRRYGFLGLLLILVCGPTAWAQESQPATGPTLEARVERLVGLLEERRVSQHIPGLAVAVVKDDKVVLSKGLGLRSVESGLPVNEETLFAIGSSTKAFTATLVGAMVADGRMGWDDPVTKHLPWFKLSEADATEQVTIRDLLCHRTGLMRTDLLWASGKLSPREVLEAVGTAKLRKPFRSAWQYSNPMFLAAGEASAQAAGMSWTQLLQERLLMPLKMSSSTTAYEVMLDEEKMSRGYEWEKEKNTFKHKKPRELTNIDPAGAINSNVIDMAQWVRFQLGRGTVDGREIIPAAIVEETWSPQIAMGEGTTASYGLGWMIDRVDDRRLIQHGGNIDGFAAQVGFFPDDGLGFVLLTNTTSNALQNEIAALVSETMLEVWDSSTVDQPLEGAQELVGKYFFEPMNAHMTVLVQNGRLAVDVPGQTVYELKPPGEDGWRKFALTDAIAVSFEKNAAGEVVAMKMQQSGLTFELPREGAVVPAEVTTEVAAKHVGRYRADFMNSELTVVHKNGRLALDVPGQMVYDLRLPNEEGKWVFRATNDVAVVFDSDEEGAVTGLTMHQGGMEFVCPKIAGPASSEEELKGLLERHRTVYGSDKIAALGDVRVRAKTEFVHQGLSATMEILIDGFDRFLIDLDLGKGGLVRSVMTRDTVTASFMGEDPTVETGDAACKAFSQHPLLPASDWALSASSVEIVRQEKVGERMCRVVKLRTSCGAETTLWVDVETDLIHQQSYMQSVAGMPFEVTVKLDDWRAVEGVLFAYRAESDNEFMGMSIGTIEAIETGVELGDGEFGGV